jgi:hypothetical protein
LTAGVEGKLIFFCDSKQHALFAQHACRHTLPIGGLATAQVFAGSRTALAKSAVSKNAVSVSRLTMELVIAQAAPVSNGEPRLNQRANLDRFDSN